MDNNFFIDLFKSFDSAIAIIWKDKKYSYKSLVHNITNTLSKLESFDIKTGSVVAIVGDFSPVSIGALFGLIKHRCVIVPLNKNADTNNDELYKIAQVKYIFRINTHDEIELETRSDHLENEYYKSVKAKGDPGLVLFSSGTSGEPKAAVHNFAALLKKFEVKRKSLRTLNFLLFDHWGGLNTMFHILSNGGTLISVQNRDPDSVCKLIYKHKIELLPVSPTFLNLLLISKAYENYSLDSLKIISYGTEPMPDTTLKRLNRVFPNVKLLQTYGLIELGVMSSKSKSNDSLWVKLGGEGYQTRIVNEILHIKADSAMLGYLNAPSPFTKDGWFITGDKVIKKGDYIRILGRESEIINVGGEKVYPQEIENIILKVDNVIDVTVYGESNPIIGNMVCAKVQLNEVDEKKIIIKNIKKYCRQNLEPYKIPVKILIEEIKYGSRFKKQRSKK